MNLYRVAKWRERFESAKSCTYDQKNQTYMPNKMGLGYQRLLRLPDGEAMYGAWCAMCHILSRQPKPRKGFLTDTGKGSGIPLSATDLALQIGFKTETVQKMLHVCSSQYIGWLTVETVKDTEVPVPSPLPLPILSLTNQPLPSPLPISGEEEADHTTPIIEIPEGAKYGDEFRTLKLALNSNGDGFTYQEFVVLFHGSRQGMVPADVITELCALVKHEPANRWNQYGVVKCLGWMLDDISKRYRIERKDYGSDPGKRRAEKRDREYIEPKKPLPIIKL